MIGLLLLILQLVISIAIQFWEEKPVWMDLNESWGLSFWLVILLINGLLSIIFL